MDNLDLLINGEIVEIASVPESVLPFVPYPPTPTPLPTPTYTHEPTGTPAPEYSDSIDNDGDGDTDMDDGRCLGSYDNSESG